MGGVERFEELIGWQKARELTRSIYRVTRQSAFARDFGLAGQLKRAALSVMSNIAEGFERGSHAEFHQFLSIAKASCAEVRSLLYVALDCDSIDRQAFDQLMAEANKAARVIGGLRAAVDRQRKRRAAVSDHPGSIPRLSYSALSTYVHRFASGSSSEAGGRALISSQSAAGMGWVA
jgi:four helix bundle protein